MLCIRTRYPHGLSSYIIPFEFLIVGVSTGIQDYRDGQSCLWCIRCKILAFVTVFMCIVVTVHLVHSCKQVIVRQEHCVVQL